ncbi:MAG: 2-isopropylmalate synthase [Candidatus Verstraetearchaeota archaeon]|nr:2-isopropylmalate synthase [Candidatus Verstraetearchaeota archaeon]
MEGVFVSNFIDPVKARAKFPERVYVLDTTLRDGEQTPGVCFTLEEKIEIAKRLDELGVDVIEAGFPVNSEEECNTVKTIKREGLKAKVCGLARCVINDIDACIKSEVDRVHIFIATSDIHLKYKLRMDEERALTQALAATEYVKDHGLECEFSCEDATRTPIERLVRFYGSVEERGADVHNVPDTVGVMEPEAMFDLISRLKALLRKPISMHCHNDFGLATANTLAGVKAGASQIHVTVNGLGERAGNASLEQTVTALTAMYGVRTGIKLSLLKEVSKVVERSSMIPLPPNFPIVGNNAFAHEAGIHVHGVLAKAESYEPLTPEMVGQKRRIVMGKHTGKHGVANFVKEKYNLTEEQIAAVVERVRTLAIRKKKITEDDVNAVVDGILGSVPDQEKLLRLDEILVVTGNKITPTASVQLIHNSQRRVAAGIGTGPVDALSKAIQSALGEEIRLLNYKLEAISGGTDSLCTVEVMTEDREGRTAMGLAVGGDIVMASANALMESLNRIYSKREKDCQQNKQIK